MHGAQALRLIRATAKPANDGHDACSVRSTWPGAIEGPSGQPGGPFFLCG